ncbi:Sensory neuron membrane protein 2 [Frankliniella fusca]|uniref:Sensory neuron membrane protein 2 n=1 Tax=Frankliniella fusca TaxID=407009 RepID=A0AAE1GU18_9NEOP|nr:Sensory neuron membrane protein 2 [Frankliniella fusca]
MRTKKGFCLAGTGLALGLAALFGAFYGGPAVLKKLVVENVVLSDDSEALERWKVTPQPLNYYTYIFHVENPAEVAKGARPVLKEKGPYVYDLFRERVDVQFHPEDDTVSYYDKTIYRFNQEKSGCHSEDDVVTILNAPVLGTGLMLQRIMEMALPLFNDALPYIFPNASTAFITAKVREVLFEGVLVNCSYPFTHFPVGPVCSGMRTRAPVTFRKDGKNYYFSMFNHLNGTDTAHRVRVNRGQRNPAALGRIVRFGNSSLHTAWRQNTHCNMINGTDTTIFHPFIRPPEKLPVFVSGSCRSMYVTFEYPMHAHGVRGLHYVADPKMLASGRTYKPNRCFCPPAPQDKEKDKEGAASAPPSVTARPAAPEAAALTTAALTTEALAQAAALTTVAEAPQTAAALTTEAPQTAAALTTEAHAEAAALTTVAEAPQTATLTTEAHAETAAAAEAEQASTAASSSQDDPEQADGRRRRRDVAEDERRDARDASTCLPDGALDMSTCFGSPVILTLPHFYLGAKEFHDYAIGLKPIKSKHETFVDIEPMTGVPLRGGKRVQLNMFLTKIDQVDVLSSVSEGLFPILWVDEGIDLEGPSLEQLQAATRRLTLLQVLPWVLVAGSALMALGGCLVHVHSTGMLQRMAAERRDRGRNPPQGAPGPGGGGHEAEGQGHGPPLGTPGNYGFSLGFGPAVTKALNPKGVLLGVEGGRALKARLAGLHSLRGLQLQGLQGLQGANGVGPWTGGGGDVTVTRTFCSEHPRSPAEHRYA